MSNDTGHDVAALHTLLTNALALADELGLTIPAIHIDEARALLDVEDSTPVDMVIGPLA